MSKGPGKVQQAILAALAAKGDSEAVSGLTIRVFHPELVNAEGEILLPALPVGRGRYGFSRAEYSTVDRAVRALERRGLVRTIIKTPKRIMGHYMGPRWKLVELISVDKV